MISKGRQQFKVRAEKNLLGNSGRDLSNSWEGSLSKKFWARLLPCTSPVFPTDSFSSKKKKIPHLHFLLDSTPPLQFTPVKHDETKETRGKMEYPYFITFQFSMSRQKPVWIEETTK